MKKEDSRNDHLQNPDLHLEAIIAQANHATVA